jgi:putative transposase
MNRKGAPSKGRQMQFAADVRRSPAVGLLRSPESPADKGDLVLDGLDRLADQRGTHPTVLRCDNGPELACSTIAVWAYGRVGLHFIPPGEPWRNGYLESFNSRIRDECLNINSFWSLAQARVVIGDWKHDYNHHRRHSALGYQPPARYAAACTHR